MWGLCNSEYRVVALYFFGEIRGHIKFTNLIGRIYRKYPLIVFEKFYFIFNTIIYYALIIKN